MLQLRVLDLLRHSFHIFFGFGPCCRFTPSCSQFAKEAMAEYGWWRGGLLSLKRLSRCHPFGGWGWDPVPQQRNHHGI